MAKPLPPIALLREWLGYNPETGALIWRAHRGLAYAGAPVGNVDKDGYVTFRIQNRNVRAHRAIWAMQTGEWPKGEVDHANGDRADNRWKNLRNATSSGNSQNLQRAHQDNGVGLLGVSPCRGSFRATICLNYKVRHLGVFATPEEAHQAYLAAKAEQHVPTIIAGTFQEESTS